MGEFGNEYVANLQVLYPLMVAIVILLPLFGWLYNKLMDSLKGKEHSSLYVAGGVLVTLIAGAAVSWKSALLFSVLFMLSGIFMIVGEYKRTEKKHAQVRRKRLPYAANGLLDDAKIAATEIHRLMGKDMQAETLLKAQRELTTVLLKLEELKNIQFEK